MTAVEPVAHATDGVEPGIDGCLIKLDGYTLDQILQRNDAAISEALRYVVERTVAQREAVAGFQNYV
ncbi:MAG TPA: hypothetical protein VFC00_37285 [Micromonosporaceae bacterium]|nr:hypothetical protein [Micromonosporaceae bacterium]